MSLVRKLHTKSYRNPSLEVVKSPEKSVWSEGMAIANVPGQGGYVHMKLVYSGKKIGGYLLAFFLLFGIITVAGASAQAQYPYQRDRDYRRDRDDRYDRRNDRYDRRNDRYGNYGYENARQQGYSYGMNVGASDAQRGNSYNPQRSHYWKNGTDGYNSSYGNKNQYKQV